jgi:F subunit of K+-transporting ATPase (Potass_KdpF)
LQVWLYVIGSCSAAKKFKGMSMIYLTAVVAAFTFGYLLMAMIRPEWF